MMSRSLGLILNREARRGVAPSKTSLPPILRKERGTQGVRWLHNNQKGFTALELLIAILIAGLIAGGVTTAVFQVVTGNTRTSNHMTAVRQVQEAGYWVSHDAQMAQDVNTDDLASPEEILELTWAEWDNSQEHQVIYSLTNMNGGLKQLERHHLIHNADGGEIANTTSVIARYIDDSSSTLTSCDVTVDGIIIFKVTARVGSGSQQGSETRVYEILPRPTV